MARTSGKAGSHGGPLSQLNPKQLFPKSWLAAVSHVFEPSSGVLLTDRLRLVRPVADGRSERIWLADHLALATRVEVTFAEVAQTDSAEALAAALQAEAQRFAQQAEVTGHIGEPHLVHILERGDIKGVPFIVTELLEGRGLRQRLLHGSVSLPEVRTVVSQAADVLGKAHGLGVAHGHLCPDVLFTTDIGDLPFLKLAGLGAGEVSQHGYCSPEQLLNFSPEQLSLGAGSDVRADLWAFAVTLYELLTTTLPFEAATPAGVSVAICNTDFSPPSNYRADLTPAVDQWFVRALAKDPAQRFQDAVELCSAFVQALDGSDGAALAAAVTGVAAAANAEDSPAGGTDTSLEMDDDGDDEDEKTVKWDLPEDAVSAAIEAPPRAPMGSLPGVPRAVLSSAALPAMSSQRASAAPIARMAQPAVYHPPRAPQAALGQHHALGSQRAGVPPTLEPAVYLDSPYIASIASALSVPSAPSPLLDAPPPGPRWLDVSGLSARLPPALRLPQFGAEKTWLAAAAFAVGVAVTWFAYDPDPAEDGGEPAAALAEDTAVIRTVSVDDLPRVASEEDELPTIVRTSALPAADEAGAGAADGTPAERRSAPVQRVQALAPVPPRAVPPRAVPSRAVPSRAVPSRAVPSHAAPAANASGAPAKAAPAVAARAKPPEARTNCNPPYYFDAQGIRRLRSECLASAAATPSAPGVVAGPYGAVIATNVTSKSPPAPASAKPPPEKHGAASCSPPYYFDGNIRRIKLECL